MDLRQAGIAIMIIGGVAIVVGWLLFAGFLSWFGRLPGDIRIVSDSTRVYIPLTPMLVVSLALTILLTLVPRL